VVYGIKKIWFTCLKIEILFCIFFKLLKLIWNISIKRIMFLKKFFFVLYWKSISRYILFKHFFNLIFKLNQISKKKTRKITYITWRDTRDTRDMRVLTKISYWIFYKTTTKYIYLESARQDLQNDVKLLNILLRICYSKTENIYSKTLTLPYL